MSKRRRIIELRDYLNDILEMIADIGEFIRQPLKTYSSGMKARLGFALAVSVRPEILVIDEVLAVGDDFFQKKCHSKITELINKGCTVLFVTHNAAAVNEICTRAILLDYGELILEGPPKLITGHYRELLYSKPENLNATREEIIELNKSINKKNDATICQEANYPGHA
jgi:lipopolysaccharide transport system ATP-binding protein